MQCSNCNTENPRSAKFCAECGTPLLPESAGALAERRQLTVLFADIVGSTTLAESMDPEELRELYARYQAVYADVVHRYDGHIAQHLGDGILVYFGYPTAHEDDALRAVRSGMEILKRIAGIGAPGDRLRVRIGIHTGVVVVGEVGGGQRREQLALGEAPNIAARVQSEAAPDTILITEETCRLVAGYLALEDCGPRALKGISRPMHLFLVRGMSGATTRFEARATSAFAESARSQFLSPSSRIEAMAAGGLAPFVGREREVESIRDAWARTVSGAGQLIVLRGEAGIGKSRLLGVARQAAQDGPHEVFEAQCSPYEMNSALHPVTEMLGRIVRMEHDQPSAETLGLLEQFVVPRGARPEEAVPLLAPLLTIPLDGHYPPSNLPPVERRQRALEILAELFLHSPDGSPVLMLIEDLHWADPSTLDLLGMLIARQAAAPLLLVCTTRPEGSVPGATAPHYREIQVTMLPEGDARALVTGVAGRKPLPEEVLTQIVARTGGVPLFVEAVTRGVIEAGVLRELDDHYELAGPLPPEVIPATVQDSLMARIDRLGPDKPVAQLASVIGREFGFELLKTVSGRDPEGLERALQRLVESDLVSQAGEPPTSTYTFKHALIRDAAYQSLLKKSRREQHCRIGEMLATRFPVVVEQRPELVAQHFAAGGDPGQAVSFWLRAGQRALARAEFHEAIAHMTRALDQLTELPASRERDERELECSIILMPALQMTQGWATPEVERAFRRSVELVELLGDTPHRLMVLGANFGYLLLRGRVSQSMALARQMYELAGPAEGPAFAVTGHQALCLTRLYLGEFAGAISNGEAALALLTPELKQTFVQSRGLAVDVYIWTYLSEALWMRGLPEQAVRSMQRAVTTAREMNHAPAVEVAVGTQTFFYQLLRDHERVLAAAEESFRLGEEHRSAFWHPMVTFYKGASLVAQGSVDEGITLMRDGLARYAAAGNGIRRIQMLTLLAEGLAKATRWDEAFATLTEALSVSTTTGETYFEPEAYRLQGELLRRVAAEEQGPERRSRLAAAEVSIREALVRARQQDAKSLELRAAMSLCLVRRDQGAAPDGREELAELLGSFTEGFDTPDLRDARTLVAELGNSR